MKTQSWILLVIALGLNLAAGGLVALLKLPIYLDSLGTVLAGVLVGPAFGALAGLLGTLVMAVSGPTVLAFAPVAILVGVSAGWAGRRGLLGILPALLWGGTTGVFTATLAAPIATAVFGGVTGGGTDLLIAAFRATGRSALEAAWIQALAVDPLDKAVTFAFVFSLLRVLPPRSLSSFPFGRLASQTAGNSAGVDRGRYRPQSERSATPNRLERLWPERTGVGESHPRGAMVGVEPIFKAAVLGFTAVCLLVLGEAFVAWLGFVAWGGVVALVAGSSARRALSEALLMLLPLAVSVVAIHGLFGDGSHGVISWGAVEVSRQGLGEAEVLLRRLAILVVPAVVYLRTTPTEELQEGLLRIGCPYPLIYTLLSAAALGPELRRGFLRVRAAQESRGLSPKATGVLSRLRRFWSTFVPTLGSVFSELPIRAASLQSRGFQCRGWHLATELRADETPAVRRLRLVLLALAILALLTAIQDRWS